MSNANLQSSLQDEIYSSPIKNGDNTLKVMIGDKTIEKLDNIKIHDESSLNLYE